MIILGIDPGLANTGWGVVELRGARCAPLAYGTITTSATTPLPQRLREIFDGVTEVVRDFQPAEVGIESVFFGTNAKSAFATGQARGVALLAVSEATRIVGEYSPVQIKKAVVGEGGADKDQVTFMVRRILDLDHDPKPDHAADALACAICHAHLRGQTALERTVRGEGSIETHRTIEGGGRT